MKCVKRSIKLITAMLLSFVMIAGVFYTPVMADEEPEYATKTTLKSGPYTQRKPRTLVDDLQMEKEYKYNPLPTHRYTDYLQSLGILFPGDTIQFLPEADPNEGSHGNHGVPGRAFYKNNTFVDVAEGDTFGPFKVTKAVTYGETETHHYLREIKVVGKNPVILQGYKASAGGWARTTVTDPNNPNQVISNDTWGVYSLAYIEIPRYQKIEYRYMLDGVETPMPATAKFQGEDRSPEVIWAEDLTSTWSYTQRKYVDEGPFFLMSRPDIKGYNFTGFKAGNDTTMVTMNNYTEELPDGYHFKTRYRNKYHLDFGFSFDCEKHGDEGDTMVILLNYKRDPNQSVQDPNPLKVSAKTAKVKYKKVRKKTQTLAVSKVLTIKDAQGALSFAKVSGNKKIKINSKTGKVTIKKKLKKGTYKVKVKVKAAGNEEYFASAWKTVTFKIKVK